MYSPAEEEELSTSTIAALKVAKLMPYVDKRRSSNSSVILMVYENQKYRPVVGEWGNAIGVHLFRGVDRAPYSDDFGKNVLNDSLTELQPLKGYKWANEWSVVVEEKITDSEGFQYARNWPFLNSRHKLAPAPPSFFLITYTRRRRWVRTMVVDDNPIDEQLPFTLIMQVLALKEGNKQLDATVETYFDGSLESTSMLPTSNSSAANNNSGDASLASAAVGGVDVNRITKAMVCLDPTMKISFKVIRRKVVKSIIELKFGVLLDELLEYGGISDYELPLPNYSNRCLKVGFELQKSEIFQLVRNADYIPHAAFLRHLQHNTDSDLKKHKMFGNSFGTQSQQVVGELSIDDMYLSSRLKEKIIMLSLAMGSNCNGLLSEIKILLHVGNPFIGEADLYDILDDINQLQGQSEFSKLLTLLQDSDSWLKSIVPYPHADQRSSCEFSNIMTLLGGVTDASSSNELVNQRSRSRSVALSDDFAASLRDKLIVDAGDGNDKYGHHNDVITQIIQRAAVLNKKKSLMLPLIMRIPTDNETKIRSYDNLGAHYRISIIAGDGYHHELMWNCYGPYQTMLKILSLFRYSVQNREDNSSGRYVDRASFAERVGDVQPSRRNRRTSHARMRQTLLDSEFTVSSHKVSDADGKCILHTKNVRLKVDSRSTCFIIQPPAEGFTPSNDVKGDTNAPDNQKNDTSLATIHLSLKPGAHDEEGDVSNSLLKAAAQESEMLHPFLIPYDEISCLDIGSEHYLSMSAVLELKVLSVQTPLLDSMRTAVTFLRIETADGQHFDYDFSKYSNSNSLLGSNSLSSNAVPINETFRILVPVSVQEKNVELDNFVFLKFYSELQEDKKRTDHSPVRGFSPKIDRTPGRDKGGSNSGRSRSIFSSTVTDDCLDDKAAGRSRSTSPVGSGSNSPVKVQEHILCAQAAVPLSDLNSLAGTERERQLSLQQNDRMYHLTVMSITPYTGETKDLQSLFHAGATAGSITFTVSYADYHGQPIVNGRSRSSSDVIAFRSSSAVLAGGAAVIWDAMDDDSGASMSFCLAQLPASVQQALGCLLVQFWSADECVGEVILPVLSAGQTNRQSLNRSTFLQEPADVRKRKKKDIERIREAHFNSQLSVKYSFTTSSSTTQSTRGVSTENVNEVKIKVNSSLKTLQPSDCSWPCRFVNCGTAATTLDPTPCQLYASQNSLHIYCSVGSESSSSPGSLLSILPDCTEAETANALQKHNLHIDVPYTQISSDQMYILTDCTLSVTISLHRMLPLSSSDGTSSLAASNRKVRDISLEVVIGPCLAMELFTVINNRIAMFPVRKSVAEYTVSQQESVRGDVKELGLPEENPAEAFEAVTSQLHDQIYSTKLVVDAICSKQNFSSNSVGHHEMSLALVQQQWESWAHQNFLVLKVLYLRFASLKLYLWYLIERSSLLESAMGSSVDNSWILFDECANSRGSKWPASDVYEDIEALQQRIAEIMRHLESDIRCILYQKHEQSDEQLQANLPQQLSRLVHDRFLTVLGYLAKSLQFGEENDSLINSGAMSPDAEAAVKIYTTADPQRKRDLIRYIISQDNVFETMLTPLLSSHYFCFTRPPLLSLCIDFDELIDTFAELVDENIAHWSTRTLRHFMSDKLRHVDNPTGDGSGTGRAGDGAGELMFTPWEVVTVKGPTDAHDYYISRIPETIQTQLNVEIGLKKITVSRLHVHDYESNGNIYNNFDGEETDGGNGSSTAIDSQTLARVQKINGKISAAIARVYHVLAGEYEKVLLESVRSQLSLQQDSATSDISGSCPTAMGDKDELMCFLISIINDCHRINNRHIPQSIESFSDKPLTGGSRSNSEDGGSGSGRSSFDYDGYDEDLDDGESFNYHNRMIFVSASRAVDSVSSLAVQHLANQMFLHTELREYFLSAFDDHVLAVKVPTSTRVGLSDRFRRNPPQVEQQERQQHSPIEIICATLSEFLVFVGKHLNSEDLEKLLYICTKKVVVRYLIFLRDLLMRLPQQNDGASTGKASLMRRFFRGGNANGEATNGTAVDSPFSDDQVAQMKIDVRLLIRLHSVLKLRIQDVEQHAQSATDTILKKTEISTDPATSDRPTESNIRPDEETLEGSEERSGGWDGSTDGDGVDSSSQQKRTRSASQQYIQRYYNNSAANIFSVVLEAANKVMTGETSDPKELEWTIFENFSIQCPSLLSDRMSYEASLGKLFEMDASTGFTAHGEWGDAAGGQARKYTVVVSQLCTLRQRAYKNSFVRAQLGAQNGMMVQETSARTRTSRDADVTRWDESLSFPNIASYENRNLQLQLYGYRFRPRQRAREKVIGMVTINLSEIAQSSPFIETVATNRMQSFSTKLSSFSGSPSDSRLRSSFAASSRGTTASNAVTALEGEDMTKLIVHKKALYRVEDTAADGQRRRTGKQHRDSRFEKSSPEVSISSNRKSFSHRSSMSSEDLNALTANATVLGDGVCMWVDVKIFEHC